MSIKFTTEQLANYRIYEQVRASGDYNMYSHQARNATGLFYDEYIFVQQNYNALLLANLAGNQKDSMNTNHIQISLEEIQESWDYWLKEKHNHLGLQARQRIQEQGNVLIRQDFRYWVDQPLTKLYNQALERVEAYWSV